MNNAHGNANKNKIVINGCESQSIIGATNQK